MTTVDTLHDVTEAATTVFTAPPRRAAAVTYLRQRGIDVAALPADWSIGYAPPGWTRLVDTLSRDFPSQALIDAGLGRMSSRDSLIDTFRDRVVFGIRDTKGSTVGFIGRDLSGSPGAPKYLNTRQHELFDKSSLLFGLWEATQASRGGQPVIVEGPLDVLAIAARGPDADTVPIAPCGTAFTDAQARQVAGVASGRGAPAVIAMDADAAGRAAAVTAGEKLRAAGVDDVRIAALPHGTDPAEYLANPAHGLEAFSPDHALPLITVQAQNAIAAQGDRMQWIEGRLMAARSIATKLATYPAAFTARQIGWLADALHLDPATFTNECVDAYRNVDATRIGCRAATAMTPSAIGIEVGS